MRRTFHFPLSTFHFVCAVAVFWATLAALLAISLGKTGGRLVYALDDPYIHMAMAKHFAEDGVWGVTRYEFSSSSSSPLWTLLIAGVYRLTGPNEITPLLMNIVAATLVVVVLTAVLSRQGLPRYAMLLIVSALAFSMPLAGLVMTGQEHVLHILVTLLFVYLSGLVLAKEKEGPWSRKIWPLVALAPLLTTARYEGVFLLFITCLLFVLRRRWLHALVIGAAGALPVVAYGLISTSHGSFWLPNPIMLKGQAYDLNSVLAVLYRLQSGYIKLSSSSTLFVWAVAALVILITRLASRQKFRQSTRIMLFLFLAATVLHVLTARVGTLFRYEAYLVALGLFVVSMALLERFREANGKHGLLVLCLLLTMPVAERGLESVSIVPQATANIHQQQYQMGLFVREFYTGATVVANDIGAINYFGDIRLIDTEGLGSIEVARLAAEHKRNDQEIDKLARTKDADIAVIYDSWFPGTVPPEWKRVGEWKIERNVICGGDVVSFYAIAPDAEEKLARSLRLIERRTPRSSGQ